MQMTTSEHAILSLDAKTTIGMTTARALDALFLRSVYVSEGMSVIVRCMSMTVKRTSVAVKAKPAHAALVCVQSGGWAAGVGGNAPRRGNCHCAARVHQHAAAFRSHLQPQPVCPCCTHIQCIDLTAAVHAAVP